MRLIITYAVTYCFAISLIKDGVNEAYVYTILVSTLAVLLLRDLLDLARYCANNAMCFRNVNILSLSIRLCFPMWGIFHLLSIALSIVSSLVVNIGVIDTIVIGILSSMITSLFRRELRNDIVRYICQCVGPQ